MKRPTDMRTCTEPGRSDSLRRLFWGSLIALILIASWAGSATPAHADICVYRVRPGDTLSIIAQRFNTTVQHLALFNGIRNVDLIFVDQRLLIPSCTSASITGATIRFPPLLRQSLTDLSPIPEPRSLSFGAKGLVKRAAVRLEVSGLGVVFQGTGSVVGQNGDTLLTAYHVVARPFTRQLRGDTIRLDIPGKPTAQLIGALPERDLALLRLMPPNSGTLRSVPIGDSDQLQVGDTVYLVGYPAKLEGELSVEGGVVIDLLSARREVRYIVTDAYAGQGSSGGLAINRDGELIGIVDALLTDPRVLDTLGYPQLNRATVIVPISQAMPLLEE
ncbi:MAG: trypsin-like peptidase domain-containing protein [Anaerolineae bacterium]